MLHYDGQAWSPFAPQPMLTPSATVTSIWGSGSSTYVAAGFQVARFDGTGWADMSPGIEVNSIWGAGSRLFAAGQGGAVTYFDGTWHNSTATVTASGWASPVYRAVWASPSEAYAVGSVQNVSNQIDGAFAHFDGTSWSTSATLYPNGALEAVSGATTIYAAGLMGGTYASLAQLMPASATMLSGSDSPGFDVNFHGASAGTTDDLVVCSQAGGVLQYDGASTWTELGPVPANPDLKAIARTSSSDLVVISADGVWRYNGP